MAKITIVNKKTVARKAARILGLGLAAAVIYGGIWSAPRLINQAGLEDYRIALERIVEGRGYDEALELFERKVGQMKFIISGTIEKEKTNFYDTVRARKRREIQTLVTFDDYEGSLSLLQEFKKEPYFTQKNIDVLQAEVDTINPANLLERAKLAINPNSKRVLSEKVEKAFKLSGEPLDEVRNLWIEASLEDAIENYTGILYPNHGVVIGSINFLKERPDFHPVVDRELWNSFYWASKEYLFTKFKSDTPGKSTVSFLDYFIEITNLLEIPNTREQVSGMINMYIDYCNDEINRITELDEIAPLLNYAIKISLKYALYREPEIIDMYLTAYEVLPPTEDRPESFEISKNLLDNALIYSSLLSDQAESEIKLKIADDYAILAEKWLNPVQAYSLSQIARGIYYEEGIKKDDERIKKLDEILDQRSYESRVNLLDSE